MKNSNKQKFSNKQGNVNINADWNVVNGIYNHQTIVDNSWYSIPHKETLFLEEISRFIVDHVGGVGWFIGGIISTIGGLIALIYSYANRPVLFGNDWNVINNWTSSIAGIFWSQIPVPNFSLFIIWIVFIIIGFFAIWSLVYRSDSRCPKCKKYYALNEVGGSKEKEIKTSKWYQVEQVRNYLCKYCKEKVENKSSFIRE